MEGEVLHEAEEAEKAKVGEQLRRQEHFEQLMDKLLNKRLKVTLDADDEKNHRLYAIKTLKLPKKKRHASPKQTDAKQEVEHASKKINQLERIGEQYADFFDKIKVKELGPVSGRQEALAFSGYVAGLKVSSSSKSILNLKASCPFRINLDEFENKEKNVQKYYALLNPKPQTGSASQTERNSLKTPSHQLVADSTDSRTRNQRRTSTKPKLTLTASSNTQRLVRTFNKHEASDETNHHHSLAQQESGQPPGGRASRSPASTSNTKSKPEKINPFNSFIRNLKFIQKSTYNPTQYSETRTKTDKNSELRGDFNKTFEFSGQASSNPSPAALNQLAQANALGWPSSQTPSLKYHLLGKTAGERRFLQEASSIERKVADLRDQCDSHLDTQKHKFRLTAKPPAHPLPAPETDHPVRQKATLQTDHASVCTDAQPFSSARDKRSSTSPREKMHPLIIKAIKDRVSSLKVQGLIASRSSVNLDDLVKGVFQKPSTYFGELDSDAPLRREKSLQPANRKPKQPPARRNPAESKKAEETRLYANLLHNFMTFGNSSVSKKEAGAKIAEFLNNQPHQFNPENLKKMAMQRGFYITTVAAKQSLGR